MRAPGLLEILLPAGFRAPSALAGVLLAVGIAQGVALLGRDEPYPLAAALLAALFATAGAVLAAFVRANVRGALPDPAAERSPSDPLALLALGIIAAATLETWRVTGIFFPLRMTLAWGGALPFDRIAEPVLPMMLAGTCLIALGAGATATVTGALWLLLYARRLELQSRLLGVALSFAGAVPYVAFALVVRAVLCGPVAFRAAGQWLALRPDEQLAYRSLLGAAPGLLGASVGLGLGISRGLWSWLEEVRAAEENSDSFLAATVRGQRPWSILLRQGLWLRRRRELGALLLAGMAGAVLIDVLSNTLIDSFRPPGFPPYPSLGAALFLRGASESGGPAALPASWSTAHVALVAASLLLLLAQVLPRRPGESVLDAGLLRVGHTVLARGIPSAHGLPPRPSLQWVIGPSGSGKSTLLRAWAGQLPRAILVPQDPDDALPSTFSTTDVAAMARSAPLPTDRVVWDLLGRLGDDPVRRRLFDPFTRVARLSRGERQRLLLALALSRARADPGSTLLLDEPTSAQDTGRTSALLDCVRDLLPERFTGSGAVVLTSHDPEPIDDLLGDRGGQAIADHVLWLENRRAVASSVRRMPDRRWEGAEARGLQQYLAAADSLLGAAASARDGPAAAGGSDGIRVLRAQVTIGGRPHAISADARVSGGELIVLSGPSGCGKSTLLREIAARPPAPVEVGYVMQDGARAFPAEMPVREVLGEDPARTRRALAQGWFGKPLDDDLVSRPIGTLSEGERQRILLAGEVLRLDRRRGRIRLLLLDEPFGAADPAAHSKLMDALLRWVREPAGRNAAILVSHSPLVDLGLARAFGVPTREWTMKGLDR
jgi:ABC-type nitrate/sulfonate/bicarbonate transport system ATPase subunit